MMLTRLVAGVVLTAVAGARRTASSLTRSDRDERADDVLVNPNDATRAPDDPSVPIAIVAAVVVGALIVVNLVALAPGRIAAGLRPATVLRSE